MDDSGSSDLERLHRGVPGAVISTHTRLGDATALVEADQLLAVMRFVRDGLDFEMLQDVTAVDYPERPLRFEMVYHLYSLSRNRRLRVKAGVAPVPGRVASLCGLWPSANWMEREVWDMYGVRFEGHPDLRRLLLYEEFEGHPLRKDYPKRGRQPLIGPRN